MCMCTFSFSYTIEKVLAEARIKAKISCLEARIKEEDKKKKKEEQKKRKKDEEEKSEKLRAEARSSNVE